MMITKPYPEEFSAGHLGRLHRLNGGSETILHAYRFLKSACSNQAMGKPLSPMHALAQLSGIDVLDYAKRHTLLPFYAYAFQAEASSSPSEWRQAHFKRFGLSSISRYAAVCVDCVEEDRSFWGASYWRRGHQLPGVRWCTSHGSVLRYSEDREAFLHSPATVLSTGTKSFTETGILDFAPGSMTMYHTITESMLKQGAPSSLSLMRDRLAAHAKNIGLSLCSYSKEHRLLSDRIVKRFPETWLNEVFPRAQGKQLGEQSSVFDHVTKPLSNGVISAQALAAALVVMFDHPIRAMTYVHLDQPPVLLTPEKKSKSPSTPAATTVISTQSIELAEARPYARRGIYANDGWTNVADAYIRYAGDIEAMARSLGSTAAKIRWRIANHRRHLFQALRQTKEYEAMCSFLEGRSIIEASQAKGIPVASIEAMLRLLHRKMTLDEPLPSPII